MNKKGKLVIYCSNCETNMAMYDAQYNGTCPKCGNLFLVMRCTRCGHEWRIRDPMKLPKACVNDKCKSPYWCRERTRDKVTGKWIPVNKEGKQ